MKPSTGSEASELTTVEFGGTRVTVCWRGSHSAKLLRVLLGAHYNRAPCPDPAQADYRLIVEPDRKELHQGDTLRAQGDRAIDVLDTLMDCIMYDLADHCSSGLMMHAAAIALAGDGLLFPGISGSGKSTLAAWLTQRGFDYLSDEMVYVTHNPPGMDGFNRPVQLKLPVAAPIRKPIKACLRDHGEDEDWFENYRGLLIDARAMNQNMTCGRARLAGIVFPRYTPGSAFELSKLTPAQAATGLMACLINARNLDGRGLPDASALADATPCFSMRYSDLDDVQSGIHALLPPRDISDDQALRRKALSRSRKNSALDSAPQ